MNFQKIAFLFVIFSTTSLSTFPAQAACIFNWRVPYGVDGSGIVVAQSGQACGTLIRHRGTMMESLSVLVPAQHGIARAEGLDRIVYQSKPGYHGTDSFTFLSDYGMKGKSNVTINVKVE